MAIEIKKQDDSASYTQNLPLLGEGFTITLNFNSTDRRWRLDILDSDFSPILLGIPLVNGYSPTQKYVLDDLKGGNFWVFKKVNTNEPLGFENFGYDKAYGLFFLSNAEEEEYGIVLQ